MTLWALSIGTDMQIHLGDIVAMLTCAFLAWIAARIYRLVAGFFTTLHGNVRDHERRLDGNEDVIDQHSKALEKWEPPDEPFQRVHQQRRYSDRPARADTEGVG